MENNINKGIPLRLIQNGDDIPPGECHIVWLARGGEETCAGCKRTFQREFGPWVYWNQTALCLPCHLRVPLLSSHLAWSQCWVDYQKTLAAKKQSFFTRIWKALLKVLSR